MKNRRNLIGLFLASTMGLATVLPVSARMWSMKSGEVVSGDLISVAGSSVTLRENGKLRKYEMKQFNDSEQQLLKSRQKAPVNNIAVQSENAAYGQNRSPHEIMQEMLAKREAEKREKEEKLEAAREEFKAKAKVRKEKAKKKKSNNKRRRR